MKNIRLKWISAMACVALISSACGSSGDGKKAPVATNTPIDASASPVTELDGTKSKNVITVDAASELVIPEVFREFVTPTNIDHINANKIDFISGSLTEETTLILLISPHTSIRLEFKDGSKKDYYVFSNSYKAIALDDSSVKVVAAEYLSSRPNIADLAEEAVQIKMSDLADTESTNTIIEDQGTQQDLKSTQEDAEAQLTKLFEELASESLDKQEIAIETTEVETLIQRKQVNLYGKLHTAWNWNETASLSDKELVALKCLDSSKVIPKILNQMYPDQIANNRGALASLKCYARQDAKEVVEIVTAMKSDYDAKVILEAINSPLIALELAKSKTSLAESYVKNMRKDFYNVQLDINFAIRQNQVDTLTLDLVDQLLNYDSNYYEYIIYGLTEAYIQTENSESRLKSLFKKIRAYDLKEQQSPTRTTRKVLEAFQARNEFDRNGLNKDLSSKALIALAKSFRTKECKALDISMPKNSMSMNEICTRFSK